LDRFQKASWTEDLYDSLFDDDVHLGTDDRNRRSATSDPLTVRRDMITPLSLDDLF
jgi:hypothetical protein